MKHESMSWVKSTWSEVKLNFYWLTATLLVIGGLIWLGKASYFAVIGVLTLSFLAKRLFTKSFTWFSAAKGFVFIVLFVSAFRFLPGIVGYWGMALLLLGFVGFLIWQRRDILLGGMRQIEVVLFGKSLDRENFGEGEVPSIYKKDEGDDL